MYTHEERQKADDRRQEEERRKMCEDKRDNVKVTQSPEKKTVCTIDINIKS